MNSPLSAHHLRISAFQTMIEFARVMLRLSPIFIANIAFFFILATAMFFYGAPVSTVTHLPVTYGETLYFCGVTGLTIGYGDIVATTAAGRLIVLMLGFLGILMTGMVTSAAVLAVQRAATRAGWTERGI
jgi:voltage-gated potassium channel